MEVGKQFIAGTASGVCLIIVGFPWDTLKVKMQVEREANVSLRETIAKTLRENGIRGLYFGVTAPLCFTGFINTVLWGFQFNLVQWMTPKQKREQQQPEITTVMKAALVSGLLITSIVTPMEIVKSRLQVGDGKRGPLQAAREIVRERGVRGLYRGATAVALVRSSNWSYFGMYALIQNRLAKAQWAPKSREANAIIAGGTAGTCFWFVAYGFDTVKAKMMVNDTGFASTVRDIHAQYGWRGFYRGLTPCLIRAFPANAAAFFGFETTMTLLKSA